MCSRCCLGAETGTGNWSGTRSGNWCCKAVTQPQEIVSKFNLCARNLPQSASRMCVPVCLSLSGFGDAPCSPSDSAVILRPVCLVWLTGPALADERREETPRGGGRSQEAGGRRVAHIKSTCQIKLLCWKQLNFAPCFISGCRLLLGHVIPCLDGLPGGGCPIWSGLVYVCIFCGQMAEIYVYVANKWICVRDSTKLNSFCLLGAFNRKLFNRE